MGLGVGDGVCLEGLEVGKGVGVCDALAFIGWIGEGEPFAALDASGVGDVASPSVPPGDVDGLVDGFDAAGDAGAAGVALPGICGTFASFVAVNSISVEPAS